MHKLSELKQKQTQEEKKKQKQNYVISRAKFLMLFPLLTTLLPLTLHLCFFDAQHTDTIY